MSESRLHKSYLNARVNVFFYLVTLFISFFSRKIFLEKLGADFVGLTSTMQNLLGFLNLAELGIGASIGYVLYKPIFDGNRDRIKEIVSVLAYLYRNVGLLILGAGLLLACFLPYIFADAGIRLGVIYFAYFAFLTSALISYFVNYRQTLLGADQRNYVVTVYFQTANIIKILLQIALVCYVGSLYLWIAIELTFGILYSFILNWKINRVYPWLKCSVSEGRLKYPENRIIVRKARQMFVHKLAGMGRTQLLPFLVYAFTSLKLVAYYGNYMLLLTKLNQLVDNFLGSTGAGVGSLIAEGGYEAYPAGILGVELIALFDSLVSDVRVVSSDGPVHYGVAGRGVHIAPFRLDCDSYQLLYQSVQGYERPVHFRLRTVSRHMGAGCHTGDNSSGGIGRRLFVGTSGSIAGRYSQFDNRYQYLEALLPLQRGV